MQYASSNRATGRNEARGELVTDGVTEGLHDPPGKHERPAGGDGDKTTAIVAAPQQVHTEATAANARPRVVLLGSDELSSQLAIALRRLGAVVTAVDEYPDAPGKLSALIGGLQPDFLVSPADAISDDALDALGGGEFIELVPSVRSVRITRDREGLRRLAADQLGLPTAPFWFVGSVGELKAVAVHAGYPLLVKPVTGVAGQGQSVVAGPDDTEAAWQRAVGHQTAAAQPRVLAETVVEVESFVTLLAVCSDGPKGPLIEFCPPIGHRDADGDVLESWQPQKMSAAALDAAKSIAARIVKALGGRGVFAVELMINGDEVYFADVTASPRDSAWVTVCSQRLSAFDLQARAILGLPVDTVMISPGAARLISARHTGAEALTAALGVPESDIQLFGSAGGVALATAPEVATARDRARQVAAALDMRDPRG
jgi:phosphoribosylglycinamide formyltransferase 2